jgi:hypothetical protein
VGFVFCRFIKFIRYGFIIMLILRLLSAERNEDFSHSPTDSPQVDLGPWMLSFSLPSVWLWRVAFLHIARSAPGTACPNQSFGFSFLKTKRREEERQRRERERKKEQEGRGGGERGERKKRRQQTVSLNGRVVARAYYELCSFTKRCTKAWIVFIFFAGL